MNISGSSPQPSKRKWCPVFGSSIIKIMNRPDHEYEEIPIAMRQTCQILISKEENLKTKGIFREGTSVSKLEPIIANFDSKTFSGKFHLFFNFFSRTRNGTTFKK
jgi:hypothetical protein